MAFSPSWSSRITTNICPLRIRSANTWSWHRAWAKLRSRSAITRARSNLAPIFRRTAYSRPFLKRCRRKSASPFCPTKLKSSIFSARERKKCSKSRSRSRKKFFSRRWTSFKSSARATNRIAQHFPGTKSRFTGGSQTGTRTSTSVFATTAMRTSCTYSREAARCRTRSQTQASNLWRPSTQATTKSKTHIALSSWAAAANSWLTEVWPLRLRSGEWGPLLCREGFWGARPQLHLWSSFEASLSQYSTKWATSG